MSKFTSILKIAGAAFALVGGTACEAVGIPLMCVGENEINKVKKVMNQAEIQSKDDYSRTEEYQFLRAEEEEKIAHYKVRFEQAEDNLFNGIITQEHYIYWKDKYENEVKYYENDFLNDCYNKSEIKPSIHPYWKDMLSKGYAKRNTGIVFTSIGTLIYLIKFCDALVDNTFNKCYTEIISDEISNIRYGFVYKPSRSKKHKSKSNNYSNDEPEQTPTNINDEYYKY